jgi:hypothetical protein
VLATPASQHFRTADPFERLAVKAAKLLLLNLLKRINIQRGAEVKKKSSYFSDDRYMEIGKRA